MGNIQWNAFSNVGSSRLVSWLQDSAMLSVSKGDHWLMYTLDYEELEKSKHPQMHSNDSLFTWLSHLDARRKQTNKQNKLLSSQYKVRLLIT